MRVVPTPTAVELYHPNGQRFLTFVELGALAEQEARRAEQEWQRAEEQRQRSDRLAERLRQLGVDPDQV